MLSKYLVHSQLLVPSGILVHSFNSVQSYRLVHSVFLVLPNLLVHSNCMVLTVVFGSLRSDVAVTLSGSLGDIGMDTPTFWLVLH
jgi:hypothetical protein